MAGWVRAVQKAVAPAFLHAFACYSRCFYRLPFLPLLTIPSIPVKSIKAIFNADQFCNIPEYQRPYVWEPELGTTIFEGIATAFLHDKHRECFLGCRIWNTKVEQSDDLPYAYNDILDGQQRFIALYLLQAVIRDLSTSAKGKGSVTKRLQSGL